MNRGMTGSSSPAVFWTDGSAATVKVATVFIQATKSLQWGSNCGSDEKTWALHIFGEFRLQEFWWIGWDVTERGDMSTFPNLAWATKTGKLWLGQIVLGGDWGNLLFNPSSLPLSLIPSSFPFFLPSLPLSSSLISFFLSFHAYLQIPTIYLEI